MGPAAFGFERVKRSDFELLGQWLAEPHVFRWWFHDPAPEAVAAHFGPTADGLEPAADFIAFHNGRPIWIVQFARFVDYPDYVEEMDGVYPVGPGTATIDYLIGDPQLIGKGLGSAMIAAFVEFALDRYRDVTHFVVPVNTANVASWRALRTAGFRLVARGDMAPDNPTEGWSHFVLRRDRDERSESAMVAAALEMQTELLPLAVDLLADFEELGSDADDIVEVLAGLGVGPSARVVDLGSGKGAVAIAIARELGCNVLGIDLHEPFVESANDAARAAGVADRCRFIHGDISKLACTIDDADAVIFAALGDVLGRLDETIRTIRLYAKPAGHIVIADCFLRDDAPTDFPGYERYTTLQRTRERLTAAGDRLVAEVLDIEEPDADACDGDARDVDRIAERALQLAAKHPHLRHELELFTEAQRDEYAFLATHTITGIWVLTREPESAQNR